MPGYVASESAVPDPQRIPPHHFLPFCSGSFEFDPRQPDPKAEAGVSSAVSFPIQCSILSDIPGVFSLMKEHCCAERTKSGCFLYTMKSDNEFQLRIINQAQATHKQSVIQEGKRMTERARTIDVAQVYELWNAYAAAANDGDLAGWISLWTDDGIQMPPGAPRRVGRTKIQQEMQNLFDLFKFTHMSIQIEQVRILGDWAYAYGALKFEQTDKEEAEPRSYSGKFLCILEKQVDGSWKIAIDCHNYDAPAR
jgi:uncharacterized protein (TIGR02246 family)